MIVNLLDRMKLPFRKNKEFLSALYDILGFYPHNIEIYRIAFSHKSLGFRRDEKPTGKDRKGAPKDKRERRVHTENTSKPLNNERLEYLGDAVLETVVSDILFRHFSNKREGFLTATRSKIVQREALNRLATEMGLESLIVAAQGTRMSHTNIGGNAFEALMGAIYLDRGYKFCHWFISNRIVGRYVDLDNVAQKEVNFKSKLLEWSQKNRINTTFKDSVSDNGEKGFSTVITIEGIVMGRGNGRSKKESQQEASKEALTRMRRNTQTYDNIFRAKEKRTAMEAEESFALPKIDEIEESLNKNGKGKKDLKKDDAPVLESKKKGKVASISDEAYDTAYDTSAHYEVIDTPPTEEETDLSFFEEKDIPAPPAEDELRAADEKLRKKRTRNRGAKTVGDAVKGISKGTSTAEEKAEKREAERLAEVERQRAKAERKRAESEKKKLSAEAKATTPKPDSTPTKKEEDKGGNATVAEIAASSTETESTIIVEETIAETQVQPIEETPSKQPIEASKEEEKAIVPTDHSSQNDVENVEASATEKLNKEEDVLLLDDALTPSSASEVETEEVPTLVIKQDIDNPVDEHKEEAKDEEPNVLEKDKASSPEAIDTIIPSKEEVVETESIPTKEEDNGPTEKITLTSLPTLTFDDIIFGTDHERLTNIGKETPTNEEKKPNKGSQNRRKRRPSASKGEGKQPTNKKEATPDKAKEKTAAPKPAPKQKAKENADQPHSEESTPNQEKRNHKRRRPYKGKRNDKPKAEQA